MLGLVITHLCRGGMTLVISASRIYLLHLLISQCISLSAEYLQQLNLVGIV